jgi:hypothetical protein
VKPGKSSTDTKPDHTKPEDHQKETNRQWNDKQLDSGKIPKEEYDDKADITYEIQALKDIKNTRDELNILVKILEDQKSITDKLFGTDKHKGLLLDDTVREYYLQKSGIDNRMREVKKMDEDAGRTYGLVRCLPFSHTAPLLIDKKINHLLELKQKQANIEQALVAEEQGRIILIFTLVTIIFVSSIYPGNGRHGF